MSQVRLQQRSSKGSFSEPIHASLDMETGACKTQSSITLYDEYRMQNTPRPQRMCKLWIDSGPPVCCLRLGAEIKSVSSQINSYTPVYICMVVTEKPLVHTLK
jgi:hypothetical protein